MGIMGNVTERVVITPAWTAEEREAIRAVGWEPKHGDRVRNRGTKGPGILYRGPMGGWRTHYDDGTRGAFELVNALDVIHFLEPDPLFSSGGMPHVTSAQHPEHPQATAEQTPQPTSKGRPIMRDSQNKSDDHRVEAGDSAKDGNCSTPSASTEQLPTVSPTFHPGGSTSGAEPAPSSAVPEGATPEQGGTVEQVSGGVIWCALCGADGRADGRDDDRCPDPRRDRAPLVSGCRWVRSEVEALRVATAATPNPRERFFLYIAPGSMVTSCVVSGDQKPTPVESWCVWCGATAAETLRTDTTHCGEGADRKRHHMATTAEEAEAERIKRSVPRWFVAPTTVSWKVVRPRWCMFCGGTEGGTLTPSSPLLRRPTDCEDRGAATWNGGAHCFVNNTNEAEQFWRGTGVPKGPPRPGPSGRSGAWARAEAIINQARREKPPPTREPPVHRSLLLDLESVFGGPSSSARERPPPVGMAESLLRAVQAIDAEHWQDADDSLTEAMVHFRAASVLLEDAKPPAELIRMRAKVARAAFAADFVADELSALRELVRREAAKGRAS